MSLHDSIGSAMTFYPVFLDLAGRPALVAGAGKVALRKVKGLLEAGARVTVVAPEALPEFERLGVRLEAVNRDYTTVSGLVLAELERIPAAGDTLRWQGLTIEVVDMDGRRIDKLLVSRAT